MNIRLSDLLNKKVYAVTNPSDIARDDMASSEGIIEKIENTRFGNMVWIQWTAGYSMGHKEPVTLNSLRPASEQAGIGVYYAD